MSQFAKSSIAFIGVSVIFTFFRRSTAEETIRRLSSPESSQGVQAPKYVIPEWMKDLKDSVVLRGHRFLQMHPSKILLPTHEELGNPRDVPTLVVNVNDLFFKLVSDKDEAWKAQQRPYVGEFLAKVVPHYEIVAWSNDSPPICQSLCQLLKLPVSGILNREWCHASDGVFYKDISNLGRNPKRVLLLDHQNQRHENFIKVPPFDGNEDDEELKHLAQFLLQAARNGPEVASYVKSSGTDYKNNCAQNNVVSNFLSFLGLRFGSRH